MLPSTSKSRSTPSTSSTFLSPRRTPSSASQFLTPTTSGNDSIRRSDRTSSRERNRISRYGQIGQENNNESGFSFRRRPTFIRAMTSEADEELRPMSIATNEANWEALDLLRREGENSVERSGGRRASRRFTMSAEERSPSRKGLVSKERSAQVESDDLESGLSGFSITEEEEGVAEEGDDGTKRLAEESANIDTADSIQRVSEGKYLHLSRFTLSKVTKNVLKCTLAYLLAELFTFVPALSDLVASPFIGGPIRNAHIISSVVVWYHPGKSDGGMIESCIFMTIGAVYSISLTAGAMTTNVVLHHYGYEQLAHVIVCLVFLGGGFAILGYVKNIVKKPVVTTSCSLVALFTSVIITKSPSFHLGTFHFEPILQLLLISLLGLIISNVVSFGIWRDCSATNFQNDLNATLDSFEVLFGLLTKTFLMDPDPPSTRPAQLDSAITSHTLSFTLLRSSLSLAKYEFWNLKIQANSLSYDRLVVIMTALAQGLTGIRSGCTVYEEEEQEIDFKEKVQESLENLSSTARNTLSLLRKVTSEDSDQASTPEDLIALKVKLERNLDEFKRSHSEAIAAFYQESSTSLSSWNENGTNDHLFRSYYFCCNCTQWIVDLSLLIDVFIEIRTREEIIDLELAQSTFPFAFLSQPFRLYYEWNFKSLWNNTTSIFAQKSSPFPEIVDGALTSHSYPSSQLSFIARLKKQAWMVGWHLRQPNLLFALKTGIGATLLSSLAFLPQTRQIWLEYRGEWSLISYMVIMSQTVGSTNNLALKRIFGTFGGATIAVVAYIAFDGNAIALPIFGALFSVPCFYVIIIRPSYAPTGRFFLLTFNLTCLYAFNLRESSIHVASIAYHRSLAVISGVLWGLLVTRFIFPYQARKNFRRGLSEYFLNSAHLYERIVRFSKASFLAENTLSNESTPLLASADFEDSLLSMEVHLQISLLKLEFLLQETSSEPRLKGPFPVATYGIVLASCQKILDLLTSMRTISSQNQANKERREMVGSIILYFSILASAISLKTPLPAFLPPAAESRDRLLFRLKRLKQLPVTNQLVNVRTPDSLLHLADVIVVKDVIEELELLGKVFQKLFGVIGGSREEFDALFVEREVV